MPDNPWLMRIENGLSAHFKQPNGPSRPGTVWSVGLKRGEETYTVMVKALLTDDATQETRNNDKYQAQTAMQYLNDQLNQGWHPTQEKEHTIYIGNAPSSVPAGVPPSASRKPWWKVW